MINYIANPRIKFISIHIQNPNELGSKLAIILEQNLINENIFTVVKE